MKKLVAETRATSKRRGYPDFDGYIINCNSEQRTALTMAIFSRSRQLQQQLLFGSPTAHVENAIKHNIAAELQRVDAHVPPDEGTFSRFGCASKLRFNCLQHFRCQKWSIIGAINGYTLERKTRMQKLFFSAFFRSHTARQTI